MSQSQKILDVSLLFEDAKESGLDLDEILQTKRRSSAPDSINDPKKRESLNLGPLLEENKDMRPSETKNFPERTSSITRNRGMKGRKFSTKRTASTLSNTLENESETSLEEKETDKKDKEPGSPTLSRKGKMRNSSFESTNSGNSTKAISIPRRSVSLPSKEVDTIIMDVSKRILGVPGLAANWRLIKSFNTQFEALPSIMSPSLQPSESKLNNINLIIDHLHRALQLVSEETHSLLEARISALLGVANDIRGKPEIAKEWFIKSLTCIQHQIGQIFPDSAKEEAEVLNSNLNLDDQKSIYEGIKRIMSQTQTTQDSDAVVVDPAWFAELLGNMGNVCYVLLETKEAIGWYRKSVLICRQIVTTYSKYAQPYIRPIAQMMLSAEAGIVRGCCQLALCFQALNRIPTAIYYSRKAHVSYEEYKSVFEIHSPQTVVHTMAVLETINLVSGCKVLSLCYSEEGLENCPADYTHFLLFRKAASTSENAALRHILWKNFLKTCTKEQFNDLTQRNVTNNFSVFVKSMLKEAIDSFEAADVENNDLMFDARLHLFVREGIGKAFSLSSDIITTREWKNIIFSSYPNFEETSDQDQGNSWFTSRFCNPHVSSSV
eukprot:NODE_64_length_26047_cov_1.706837.p3 type:complete len:607 gc:universal NODE_64_length_26047_cov_1.706837:18419-20239(+)